MTSGLLSLTGASPLPSFLIERCKDHLHQMYEFENQGQNKKSTSLILIPIHVHPQLAETNLPKCQDPPNEPIKKIHGHFQISQISLYQLEAF